MAQRAAGGVAGREERGRHAHPVRPRQRDVRDGAGAPGRRRCDPAASGGGRVSAAGRGGRELPGRTGPTRGRAGGAGRPPHLPRQVRDALRRRDRHHEAALDRTPHHARPRDPRQRQELPAGRRRAAVRAGAAGGEEEGTGRAGARAGLAGRSAEGRRDQAKHRPGADLHRVPGVSEVRHGQPLLRLQAGLAGRGRPAGASARASREGGRLLPHARRTRRRRTHPAVG